MKKKKKYIKPEIEVIKVDTDKQIMTTSSVKQCDCYEYQIRRGCFGCKGNCGCNHWDEDLQELVPGC